VASHHWGFEMVEFYELRMSASRITPNWKARFSLCMAPPSKTGQLLVQLSCSLAHANFTRLDVPSSGWRCRHRGSL
jgi:hypothetical protein